MDELKNRGVVTIFSQQILQRGVVERGIRFTLAFSSSRDRNRFADFWTAVLALPVVKHRIAHTVLATQFRNRHPRFLLLQDADNLFIRVRDRFIRPSPLGRTLTPHG
jgi:hypothetical protein